MDVIKILFSLLRCELQGIPLDTQQMNDIDDKTLSSLFSISTAHDIAHIVASALCKNGALGNNEISEKFRRKTMEAICRYERSNNEFDEISKTLREARVPFVPLKGAVIRQYYPEPWMRTSCDIDILVRKEDFEKAISALKSELGYRAEAKCNYHDISLYSQTGVHLELHFSVKENKPSVDSVLERVWDYAMPTEEGSLCYKLQNEFLMFYFIAHAAYHFLNGGCGVRMLIDLNFLEDNLEYDEELFATLLKEAGLYKFCENMRKLSRVWMRNEPHTETTLRMENYILLGELYGTLKNNIAVEQNKTGGRLRYALGKLFIPYESMKKAYPILKKHKWLTPFMQVRRWLRIIFTGRTLGSVRKLRTNATLNEERTKGTKELLELLEL